MKTTRRQFLAAGAVLAALPHALSAAEPRPAPTGLIDCQSHLFCPELLALMEKCKDDPVVFTKDGTRFLRMGDWLRKVPPLYLDVDAKVATMDAAGIAMTALSINDPGPEWFGADGPTVAQMVNDFIAGLVRKYPTRFFGLGVLPWQDVPASLRELDRCAELGLPVLLHPAKPVTTEVVKGYEMTSSLGNLFDNTIALTRLIMSGVLDELPKLQLVCPHLGGTLPSIIGRLDHQVTVLKRGPKNLTRTPSEYLKSIWLDIVSPLPLAMKFAVEFMGAGRLLLASDHPWVEPRIIINALRSLKLPVPEEQRILRGNARTLFQLP